MWVWDIPNKQKSLILSQTKTSDFYGKEKDNLNR